MINKLRISIITPSFNQGKYIEENILSVLNQSFPNFEHIVIDGGSTDNTLNVLKKYSHLRWVSEPDEGQADALNKGLAMATGDVIGWINSDDYYLPNIFYEVANVFSRNEIDWLVSNIYYLYNDKLCDSLIKSITYSNLCQSPDIVRQQGAFYTKSILNKINGFNKNLHMTMDFDLWLRLSKISTPYTLSSFTACFRLHEDQKTSYKNILKQYNELNKILKNENVSYLILARIGLKKYKSYLKKLIKFSLIRMKLLDTKYLKQNFRE
jgi:glycosyltransferase involved in cell wall biosynthesis